MIRDKESAARGVVSSFAEDRDGSIWVGFENYNLGKFDPEKMTFLRNTNSWPALLGSSLFQPTKIINTG